MPMGVVNNQEFERQVNDSGTPIISPSKTKVITPEILPMDKPGRNEGDVNVPNSVRNLIGTTSVENGRKEALELGSIFGISSSSVSAYTKGATSTASYDERPNVKSINSVKERLGKHARNKLRLALSHITSDKMQATTVRELAGVAKDMAMISKAMEPESEREETDKAPVQFVFYAPQVNQENHYKTIKAKDDF
jgi:hypothetical protein